MVDYINFTITLLIVIYLYIYHHNSLTACLTKIVQNSGVDSESKYFFMVSNTGNKPVLLTDIDIDMANLPAPGGVRSVNLFNKPIVIEPNKIKDFCFQIPSPFHSYNDISSYTIIFIFTIYTLKGKQYDLYKYIDVSENDIENTNKNYYPFKLKKGGSWINKRWGT